jgi:hypothetical protein
MNIDKAIRKQKKSYKRFLLSMCFIFFALPAILILSKKVYIFYIVYLIIIESLILMSIFIRISNESLKFKNDGYRLKISIGINNKKVNIITEKVSLVHVEDILSDKGEVIDFKIILIAGSKFRSDRMLPISINFLKKYSYIAYHYNRIKVMQPEDNYYYTIIKRGGLNKYPLLDIIYKTCVYSYFTGEAIEKIKIYRENSQYY